MTLNEIGERLRQRREELGLSLRDAQTATKIRWRYLEALEQGDDSVIPGYVYAKGFLRTYAEYLGLDGWELVEFYKQAREGPGAESTRGERRREQGAAPAIREGPAASALPVGGGPLTLPPRRPPAGRRRSGAFFAYAVLSVMLAAALVGVYYLYLAAQQAPVGEATGSDSTPGEQEPARPEPPQSPTAPPEEVPDTEPDATASPLLVSTERSGSVITYRIAVERLAIDVDVQARCWVRVEADGTV
ncbi:MAG TPA: helix-turn-helix domain-containing protein, partial [Bacillota bacterium]